MVAMEPVVHLRSAVSVLGRFPALAGVDLDVQAGEICHLEGPNGAGKTTLLRVCAGLVGVVDGDAVVLGHDLRVDRRAVRTQVGLVGHETFLYGDLTVLENLRFWARAVRVSQDEVVPSLARLGVSERLHRVEARNLSTGQGRRVSFAAMLLRRPRLWLLDEPHAGLDQSGRDLVDELIHQAAAAGATVLVASHEIDRAQRLGGRTVTMAGGAVVAPTRDAPRIETVADESSDALAGSSDDATGSAKVREVVRAS
jgi:heme ABC exporter ATP-binding subunit CcmA